MDRIHLDGRDFVVEMQVLAREIASAATRIRSPAVGP
jgi:hypothetical protein